jgi:hypothetical protein
MKEKKYFSENFQKYDKEKNHKFPKFQKNKKSKNLLNSNFFFARAHSDVQLIWGHHIETFLVFFGFICIKLIKLASVDFPPRV